MRIIESKNNTQGELIIILFEKCNLSCLMCMQNHSDETGIDSIREKIYSICNSLDVLKSKGKTSSVINLMGGELFEDSLADSIFEDYLFLIEEIRSYSDEINFPVNIQISTNLIWNKTSRVKQFLDKSKIKITASYDPAGRFNLITFDKFKENVKKFKDYISQIGVVMTKPSIELFMKNQVPFFNHLYSNFNIVFDHYSAEAVGYKSVSDYKKISIVDSLIATDTLLRDFYKFMFNTWPNCYPFKELTRKGLQPMFCMSTVTIPPDSSITSCEKYDVKIEKPVKVVFGKLNEMKETWFDDYDCFSCEHMQRCSMGCFANHLRSGRTQKECWLKEVYDYVDSYKT
jgi:radical SAM protein with 4Fe4S-binding SPASM domain